VAIDVDVVVVGLGPGGERAASMLARAGLEVVGVEEHLVGGECRYYGCTPSKMLVRSAVALAEVRRTADIAGTATVMPDWSLVADRISSEGTHGWHDDDSVHALEGDGVRVIHGRGRLDGPGRVVVGDQTFVASRGVILATGTDPSEPPIPGLGQTPYLTNRDIFKLRELPASLICLGGGAVGVELTQALTRFGVQVTLIEAEDRILSSEEPEVSELLADRLRAENVDVIEGAEVQGAGASTEVELVLTDRVIRAERLLVATGRRPRLRDIGLETVGLDDAADSVEVDGLLRAGDGLWAIGDITGQGPFSHVAHYQAERAAHAVLDEGRARPADYRAVPRVTFTDPEVGSVGMTARAAIEEGLDIRIGRADLSESPRGWLHGPGNDGLVKLVATVDRNVLVGATVAGPMAGEMLAQLTLAVHAGVSVPELDAMIYAFPTFHEAVHSAVRDLLDAG
jgi:pyruvate/2-oxoglutarate dehydrogenase complex dihydrolipoamide dehydrogenase (E3) component